MENTTENKIELLQRKIGTLENQYQKLWMRTHIIYSRGTFDGAVEEVAVVNVVVKLILQHLNLKLHYVPQQEKSCELASTKVTPGKF